MNILKGLALSLLGLLLFLSLAVFGLVFTLNSTILNPNFIVSEMDKLDISSLAEEFISEQTPDEEFPEEFRATLIDTITRLEPQVKEQVGAAIYPVYDYLRGGSESLDLALVLGDTFLSADFVTSLLDELDISHLAGEFLSEQIIEQIPAEELPEEFSTALVDAVDDVIAELEPWVKEQVDVVAPPIFDYILGKSQSLNVVISLEPVVESLEDTLREAFLESPPPELAGLSPAELERYFDEFFGEFVGAIPSTFEIDESVVGPEIPAQIAEALAEAEAALEQARQYVGYFLLGYKLLIGFILLLILGIVLIYRQVKGATREIGIIFLTYGVLQYVGIFIAKHFTGTMLAQPGMPVQFQTLLPQLLNDFLAPLGMLCIGLMVAGVALIVTSFVYKPR